MIASSTAGRGIATATLAGATAILLHGPASHAEDLNRLIPGLYGGDGIHLATTTPHEAHFSQESGSALTQLNQRLATSFGRFPVSSSSGNFALSFDPDLGTFVNTVDTLGPIFAERAPTIGKGKFLSLIHI